jgi:3-methyladenine DNA glycosylase AlkD
VTPSAIDRDLIDQLRAGLRGAADPEKAAPMQAYMKSAMPFLGVSAVPLRATVRPIVAALRMTSQAAWLATVRAMWDEATHREERYAALELVAHRAYRPFRTLEALPLYRHLVLTGAWWDLVDVIATHHVGELLTKNPAPLKTTLLAWAKDPDMWIRRTAILSQNRRKHDTDLELLFGAIAPSIESKEFFLRKAIGWALRELAKSKPDVVRRYVAEHEAQLSGLSKREALKHL